VVTACRWVLVGPAESAGAVLGLQALHGFTYGLFPAASVAILQEHVPPSWRTPVLATIPLGAAAAMWLSGLGYDWFGSVTPVFTIAGAIELAAIAFIVFLPNAPVAVPVAGAPAAAT
jgi:MFS transporter, PPP family, 3-phenylpropionic acid transporter